MPSYGYIFGNDNNQLISKEMLTNDFGTSGLTTDGQSVAANRLLRKMDIKSNWRDSGTSDWDDNRLIRGRDIYKPADGYLFKFTNSNINNPWRLSLVLVDDEFHFIENLAARQYEIMHSPNFDSLDSEYVTVSYFLQTICESFSPTGGGYVSFNYRSQIYDYSSSSNFSNSSVQLSVIHALCGSGATWENMSNWGAYYVNNNPIEFKNAVGSKGDNMMDWTYPTMILIFENKSRSSSSSDPYIHSDYSKVKVYDIGESEAYNQSNFNNSSWSPYNNTPVKTFTDPNIHIESRYQGWSTYYHSMTETSLGSNYYRGPARFITMPLDLNRAYSIMYKN